MKLELRSDWNFFLCAGTPGHDSDGCSRAYWRYPFEERLAAQMKEREMATAELGFKRPLSKEERFEKKRQRLAAIGEDLLAIAADQPFRFPATFTFVVRAFSGSEAEEHSQLIV
eukprot:TRINITY_DN6895_c1_g1_i3.p1 TRINITY_DN6895_c1_g1~~TRINITY_DN6895_c1_g1_i3.p1  ORF type:complete len:114 (+),score=28.56 TRINITY_DN6895_c1_g1_i3:280-621(+)